MQYEGRKGCIYYGVSRCFGILPATCRRGAPPGPATPTGTIDGYKAYSAASSRAVRRRGMGSLAAATPAMAICLAWLT